VQTSGKANKKQKKGKQPASSGGPSNKKPTARNVGVGASGSDRSLGAVVEEILAAAACDSRLGETTWGDVWVQWVKDPNKGAD